MVLKTVDISETPMSLQELLSLINEETEIVLTEGNKPLARLSPILPLVNPRIPGLHPGAISISDDFDEPLPEEFWAGGV